MKDFLEILATLVLEVACAMLLIWILVLLFSLFTWDFTTYCNWLLNNYGIWFMAGLILAIVHDIIIER